MNLTTQSNPSTRRHNLEFQQNKMHGRQHSCASQKCNTFSVFDSLECMSTCSLGKNLSLANSRNAPLSLKLALAITSIWLISSFQMCNCTQWFLQIQSVTFLVSWPDQISIIGHFFKQDWKKFHELWLFLVDEMKPHEWSEASMNLWFDILWGRSQLGLSVRTTIVTVHKDHIGWSICYLDIASNWFACFVTQQTHLGLVGLVESW